MQSELTQKIQTTETNQASNFDWVLLQLLTELSQSHDALAERVSALEKRFKTEPELQPVATASGWTADVPKKDGYYWWRLLPDHKPTVFWHQWKREVRYAGEWWPVPIQPPGPPAADAGLMAMMAEVLRDLCRVSGFSKEYDAARAVLAEYAAGVDERAPV